MEILTYGTATVLIGAACACILWLHQNGRAKAYRKLAAWALSNADAHDTRMRRRAEYMAEAA